MDEVGRDFTNWHFRNCKLPQQNYGSMQFPATIPQFPQNKTLIINTYPKSAFYFRKPQLSELKQTWSIP